MAGIGIVDYNSSDSEEDIKEEASTGLFARLPNPKKAGQQSIQQSHKTPMEEETSKRSIEEERQEETKRHKLSDDKAESHSFFTLAIEPMLEEEKNESESSSDEERVSNPVVIADYEAYAAQFAAPYASVDATQPEIQNEVYSDVDLKQLQKMGHRVSKQGPIKFKEVKQLDQVANMPMKESEKNASTVGISSSFDRLKPGYVRVDTRRHNIMSLVHDAKARQTELQNQAANRRANQRQTRNKYGF